jgi:hypothetical protein
VSSSSGRLSKRNRAPVASMRPAWRWLWVAVGGAIAALVGIEAAVLPDALRSALELGAALAAIVATLIWVRANREALAQADLRYGRRP